jgi:hypothetical protein
MHDGYRRRVLWHGALFLVIALGFGILTAAAPHSRAWMAAHLVALIGSVLVLAVGLAWPDLRLGPGQRKTLFALLLTGMYAGIATSTFAALVEFPGPATRPGVSAPEWQTRIFLSLLVLIVPSLLIASGLLLHGLRGREASQSET